MEIFLQPLIKTSVQECEELVAFVNENYESPLSLQENAVSSGASEFFWAVEKTSQERVGVTAYTVKTPFLAETVKTVIGRSFRGQGLGAKLSELIEAEVRSKGFTKIMTTIYVTNLPMIFIKLKQGYFFEGFHPNHEKLGLHEYSLGKVLTSILK